MSGEPSHSIGSEHADSGWDDYAERVLRNEGRLEGLEVLVSETRDADRKLIEQRSDSLAKELERREQALKELVTARADATLALGKEERDGDRREYIALIEAVSEKSAIARKLLREVYDTAIKQNYEQSQQAIHSLEQRRNLETEKLEQMVRQWRDSDREARELFASELDRHLDQLNHNNERVRDFMNHSVTRELWQSENDSAAGREGLIREQIISIEKVMLTMTPIQASDKAHTELKKQIETAVAASAEVLDNKIGVVAEKVEELKTYRDHQGGRASGYSSFVGWVVAILTILVSAVILANAFLR